MSENSAFIEDLYLTKDKRGGNCRKFCFGLYFIITWSLTGLVAVMIFLAPDNIIMDKHFGHSHHHQNIVISRRETVGGVRFGEI